MLKINPEEVEEQLVKFLKNSFKSAGFIKAVIGLSGGVDSATSCALAVKVMGEENVFPVLLPHGKLNPAGLIDAKLVIKFLQIPIKNITEINIEPIVTAVCHSRETGNPFDQMRRGNIMARLRMIYIFDEAKKRKALVVGTENKTEHLLGYFTRFGDEASDVEPLRNLYKTQVYELAKHLDLPKEVLTKAPTAGLWEGQTDEGEFGFTYQEADQVLNLIYDEKKPIEEIVETGFGREIIDKIQNRVKQNQFKHHLPITVKED